VCKGLPYLNEVHEERLAAEGSPAGMIQPLAAMISRRKARRKTAASGTALEQGNTASTQAGAISRM
jgi:hypothetical protein